MYAKPLILIVSGDRNERDAMIRAIGSENYYLIGAADMESALGHMQNPVDLVVSDLRLGARNGLDLLMTWHEQQPQTAFVLVAEHGDVDSAVEAMKLGATDCVAKPIKGEELPSIVAKWLESARSGNSQPAHLQAAQAGANEPPNIDIPPGMSLEELERVAVQQALQQHQGNRTHAAKMLGISVRTLQRKLKAWQSPILSLHGHFPTHDMLMPRH